MWKFATLGLKHITCWVLKWKESRRINRITWSYPTFAAFSAKSVSVLPIIERDEFVGQFVLGHEGLVLFGGHVAVDCVNWSGQRFLAMQWVTCVTHPWANPTLVPEALYLVFQPWKRLKRRKLCPTWHGGHAKSFRLGMENQVENWQLALALSVFHGREKIHCFNAKERRHILFGWKAEWAKEDLIRTCVPCCAVAGCLAILSAILELELTPKAGDVNGEKQNSVLSAFCSVMAL